jgi:hypothetical protein
MTGVWKKKSTNGKSVFYLQNLGVKNHVMYCTVYATCEVLFCNFNFKNIINIKNMSK